MARISDPPLQHLFDGDSTNVYNEEICNLCAGTPGPDILRACTQLFQEATHHRMEKEKQDAYLFQYGPTAGPWEFREELSRFLTGRYNDPVYRYKNRALSVVAYQKAGKEDLVLTCGATHGLQLILNYFVAPNGVIFVEEVTYMIAINVFQEFSGMKIVPVPFTDKGVDVMEFESIARHEREMWRKGEDGKAFWAVLYCIPSHHNPTGICSARDVCEGVLGVARSLDLLVVCDDVYNLLHYSDEPPPQRWFSVERSSSPMPARHVVSNGSFSKILAPGVRVGWLELPGELALPLRKSGILRSGGGVNSYMAGVITSALQLGLLQRNLDGIVATFKSRMRGLCDELAAHLPADCSFRRPSGGYFVWVRLPEHVDGNALQEYMRTTRKVSAFPGNIFSPVGKHRNCLRLAIAFHGERRLRSAAQAMCEAIGEFISNHPNEADGERKQLGN